MLFRRQPFFLFFLILLFNTALSQNAPDKDSLLYKKAADAFALAFSNSDSALLLANEALREAEAIKNRNAEANAYNSIGWAYMHKGNLDSSIIFLHKSWQLFSSLKSDFDITRVDINLAEVYTKQFKITDAIKYLMQADSLSIKINSIPLQTDVKRQLAIVYRESGDKQKASMYFKEALNGFVRQRDYIRYINTAVSLSILFRNMNLNDSSLSILNQCRKIANEKSGTPYQKAMIDEHTAETYLAMNNYEKALHHYTHAYKLFAGISNKADMAYEGFCIGKTLSKLKRPKEAESYLLESYAICDTLKMANYQADIANELSLLYRESGNWQKAYQYLQKYDAVKDSLGTIEQVELTNELKEKFESAKKEQEILLLKTKNQLAETDNKRTRLLQYLFIILFITAVIIGWLLYNRSKIRRKLQEQLLRNQIAGDLHDDIGSALSSIDISSRIALVKKDDSEAVETQLQKIRQQAHQTLESMSDIVWSINPGNDSFENTLARLREFAFELCEPLGIAISFELPQELETTAINQVKRKNLFLICKEAINNAAKYSNCKTLSVRFEKAGNGNVLVKIQDDGSGFNEEEVKKGNGLRNMKARAQLMEGSLSIYSTAGNGTAVELVFPVSK